MAGGSWGVGQGVAWGKLLCGEIKKRGGKVMLFKFTGAQISEAIDLKIELHRKGIEEAQKEFDAKTAELKKAEQAKAEYEQALENYNKLPLPARLLTKKPPETLAHFAVDVAGCYLLGAEIKINTHKAGIERLESMKRWLKPDEYYDLTEVEALQYGL